MPLAEQTPSYSFVLFNNIKRKYTLLAAAIV